MGIELHEPPESVELDVDETIECAPGLPHSSSRHARVLGGDVHHFLARRDGSPVGHAVLNVVGASQQTLDVLVMLARSHSRRWLPHTTLGARRSRSMRPAKANPLHRSFCSIHWSLGMTWWLDLLTR
jgi:hypothetical protein